MRYLAQAQCDGSHQRQHIEGGFRQANGKWMSLSVWAGGYGQALCKALLRGCEEWLRSSHQIIDGHEAIEEEEERDLEDDLEMEMERHGGGDGEEREPPLDSDLEEEPEEDERHWEVQKVVEFAHRQLGHPSRSTLVRMMKLSGATSDAIRYAKKWKCSVCMARQMPKHPQATTATTRPYGFNKTLHIDVKYLWDARGKRYAALSILDLGTCKHDAHMIKTRRSDYVASKFLRKWIQPYGSPELIVHDQGGEFEGAFVGLLEQFSVSSKVTGAHAGGSWASANAMEICWARPFTAWWQSTPLRATRP